MNYPRYPEYKPSGVEWLGEVPAHWGSKRLKFATACINDKLDVLPEGLEYVALEHIESWTGKRLGAENGLMPESQTNRFQRGDVLFGKLRPYLAKAWLADRDGVCSTELLVFRERDLEPAYLRYWTLMQSFVEIVDGSTYGSKMPRASWDFIGNVPALIPERDEQRAIAAFLDRETARIDALIAKKQRLTELLAEKRTALISQAVTKGLNPDAPMKDSGVEWLGEIPAHWTTKPLRWHVRLGSGDYLPNEQIEKEADGETCIPVIGGNGLLGYTKIANTVTPTIVVGRVGALCGNVHHTEGPAWITDNALRFTRIDYFDRPYLALALLVLDLNRWANKTAQPLITGGMVKEQKFPAPPLSEQETIVEHVKAEGARLDQLANAVQGAINSLFEYRAALIADAVTGKIDVRGLVQEKEVA